MFEDVIKKPRDQGGYTKESWNELLREVQEADEDVIKKQDEYFIDFLLRVKPFQQKVFLSLLGENTYDEAIAASETYVMLSIEEYNELKGGKK